MPDPAPSDPKGTPQPPASEQPPSTSPAPPSSEPKTPPWGSDENFNPEKAWELIENLRREKAPDTKALESQVAELRSSTEARNKALAEALGLTEAPKSEDDLAETVKTLQTQFKASQDEAAKLRVAVEKGVPAEYQHLLTETDPEKLNAQAEMAAEYARLKAAANGTPQFQPIPGQGQGGQPPSEQAQAEAEYAKYYPVQK